MTFNGAPHGTGGYCLQRASVGCTSPYRVNINTVSLSGAGVDDYCGINQAATTCEALLDLFNGKACTTDPECGAASGGLCKNLAAPTAPPDLRCTIPCGTDAQCPSGNTCSDTTNGWCK
jgi:hypothetical protein